MKKLEDYPWICPEPFTNVHVYMTGEVKPCCTIDINPEMMKYPEFVVHNVNKETNDSFSDFYWSPAMKRLRAAMKSGKDNQFLEDFCFKCKLYEASGNRSQRQYYIGRFDNEFADKKEELERIIDGDLEPTFYHSMELKPLVGNKCNLACNMCGDEWSSKYASEAMKLGEIEKRSPVIKTEFGDKFKSELPEILDKLEELKLVGGEPLLSKQVYETLAMVKNPERMRLKVITNGTVNPDRFIELAKHFREVDVNISIEGHPPLTEYIRHPSKWSDIWENYNKFKHIARTRFVSTINALNIGYMPELQEYMESLHVLHSQNNPVINNEYTIESIPPDIRKLYLNKLYKAKAINMIKFLEFAKYKEEKMWQMMNHVKRRDKLRGTCLLDVAPEWAPYYNKVIV